MVFRLAVATNYLISSTKSLILLKNIRRSVAIDMIFKNEYFRS